MNIEIANRLVDLRKKNGLSQEELASKLGLSRQAVSKWERAEASPDTDNLICLAKLYGVSLDELLKTDDGVETIVEEQVKDKSNNDKEEKNKLEEDGPSAEEKPEEEIYTNHKDGIHLHSSDGDKIHFTKDGLFIHDSDGDEVCIKGGKIKIKDAGKDVLLHKKGEMLRIVEGCIVGSLLLIVSVLYVTLGCLFDGVWPYPLVWPIGWVGFLFVPLTACIFETIRKKTFTSFEGAIVFITIIAYMILGFVFNAWHPGWAVFFAIPLYAIFSSPMDKALRFKDKGKTININLDEEDEEE